MSYYLLNWFLHFGLGVIICGLGVFFIFLSSGKFDDVASWLYSSRNFLLLIIKGISFLLTFKILEFYKRGVVKYESLENREVTVNLFIFLLLAIVLKFFVKSAPMLSADALTHLICLAMDFTIFFYIRKYYQSFTWLDLLLIAFTQVVIYFGIYQESFYLSLIGIGFFYFLYQYLNKWNHLSVVCVSAFCGSFMFAETMTPKQEMFFYYFSLFSGYYFYLFLRGLAFKRKEVVIPDVADQE